MVGGSLAALIQFALAGTNIGNIKNNVITAKNEILIAIGCDLMSFLFSCLSAWKIPFVSNDNPIEPRMTNAIEENNSNLINAELI